MKIATTKKRILQYIDYKGISKQKFFSETGLKRGFLDADKLDTSIPDTFIATIIAIYPEMNLEWLLTGKGKMLNKSESATERKKIPVFDAETIGGVNERIANMEGVSAPSEWIDAGDWFMDATAAIHHYGDSMVEYPSGCILALREVFDLNLVVWGKNYVIETDEYRITKRLQRCDSDSDYFMVYSTNPETYPDGKLIHEPVTVPKKSIRRLAMVLGYVVKEQSSGMVYNVRNKK
jgi:hypothetical protein